MPFPRRGRRRPFINSRWQLRRLEALCLFLSPAVRSTLTAWMKIYGETNDVAGLISGPIEVRFRRLREHTGADVFLLWTTPERWAAGDPLSLWIPAIGLALECTFEDGRLVVDKARPVGQEDRDPRRQRSAIGMELRPDRIELPTDVEGENPSAGLVASFERLLDRRWTSFVDPLREALEAEARDDSARAERLATPYAVATPRIGSQSESDPYRLSGVEASAVAAFDEGEWLDLVDTRGRVISSARLVRIDPAEGVMDVDVRGADPPSEGIVRPRPQTQILAQKRAILEELDNPTGGLANAVKLVASPASLPPPQRRRPAAFVNRLVAQNKSQVRAVSLALGLEEGQALMVQGPPGTGKSTTLAEVLGQLVTRDQNVTVLVCSHSNHGVDNLLLKTLPYLDTVPGLAIARVGLFDRVHPQARPHFVPPGEDLGAYNVVFTTVDALALQVEAGGRTYDYAVLDEANRASILDSLIPLVRGRRFILVGDHLQLQPVLSEAEEQLRLEPAVGNTSAIGKSLFAWLRDRRFPEAATVFLDEQNRMHPVIAGLISEVFYEGKLRSGRRAPRRVADVPLFPAAVTWVDTRGLHGLREARGRGASLVNVPEARLVATIARHILNTSQREVEVGVISAYAEQTALLRRLLIHRNNQRQNGAGGATNAKTLDRAALRHLEIDTVDAFEGREKDIILVSLVRSNRRRDIGFLRLMQRINVALSRARTMLIVVGDTSTLRGSYFDKIVRYVRANGMLVPGPRLIGRLLNARSGERPAERVGERPGAPGRRRRPLPSARTAFPAQDPAAAAGAAGGTAAGAEDGQRGRRRRRRVRGRPDGEDRRIAPPSTTMEMGPAVEPGADEPATQYEIDRFAALVEQLLGDTGGDDTTSEGEAAAAAPEVDRAHAEEVLAEALRAVGEQRERGGSSRSRRGNNRRRSRRGQGRPLPGDAAIADAARRMADEERQAGEYGGVPLGDAGEPGLRPPAEALPGVPGGVPDGSSPGDVPPGEVAASAPGETVRPPRQPIRVVPGRTFAPVDEPPMPTTAEPASAPPRRRTRRRVVVSEAAPPEQVSAAPVEGTASASAERGDTATEAPREPVAPSQPSTPAAAATARARRTRRTPAGADGVTATTETAPAATTPSPAQPVEAAPMPMAPAAETPSPQPAARPTRRRREAVEREPAGPSVPPAAEPAASTPARRTRRAGAVHGESATDSTVQTAPTPVGTAQAETPPAPPVAAASATTTPAGEVTAPASPVRRGRRTTPATPTPSIAVVEAPPAPNAAPRRSRRTAGSAGSATTDRPPGPVETSPAPVIAPTEGMPVDPARATRRRIVAAAATPEPMASEVTAPMAPEAPDSPPRPSRRRTVSTSVLARPAGESGVDGPPPADAEVTAVKPRQTRRAPARDVVADSDMTTPSPSPAEAPASPPQRPRRARRPALASTTAEASADS